MKQFPIYGTQNYLKCKIWWYSKLQEIKLQKMNLIALLSIIVLGLLLVKKTHENIITGSIISYSHLIYVAEFKRTIFASTSFVSILLLFTVVCNSDCSAGKNLFQFSIFFIGMFIHTLTILHLLPYRRTVNREIQPQIVIPDW